MAGHGHAGRGIGAAAVKPWIINHTAGAVCRIIGFRINISAGKPDLWVA